MTGFNHTTTTKENYMWTTGAILLLLMLAVASGFISRRLRKEQKALEAKEGDRFGRQSQRLNDVRAGSFAFRIAAFVLAGLTILALLTSSFTIVGANEVGVPKTLGKIGSPVQSGPHLIAPWTSVEKLPTRPRTVTTVTNVRTSQSGHAAIRIATRWNTDRQDASELYQQARTSDEGKIEKDIITPQVDGAANEFYGTVTNVDAITGSNWSQNALGVQAKVQERLQRYGIHLVDVQIREVNPDSATDQALAQVAAQQRQTEIAIESKTTAEKQAGQRLAEATGIKNAADKLKDLTPGQVNLLCLQAAERVMNENVAKGIPTYVTPCGGGSTSVIAK
jgi:regulator of protease activity HflC (stomatin/prohibitin superfamily)